MIITCPNCNKQFIINPSLIYIEGRDLQCGSCSHVWFYRVKDENKNTVNDNIVNKKVNKKLDNEEFKTTNVDEIIAKPRSLEKKSIKLLSYLIVFIISFSALIILLDTLKTPLIKVFPEVEIILFNLFETLQDIKLFIIDLI